MTLNKKKNITLTFTFLILGSIFLSGCGNNNTIVGQQQKQLDDINQKIKILSDTSTQKKLENQIKNLKSQVRTLQSETEKKASFSGAEVVAMYVPKTVQVWCSNKGLESFFSGSGSLISSTGRILTNQHVVDFLGNLCIIGITNDPNHEPKETYFANVIDENSNIDLATLQIKSYFNPYDPKISDSLNINTLNLPFVQKTDFCLKKNVHIGDKLFILGYPGVGGQTITATEGTISGFEGPYIKTSAKIEHGNSGGLAVQETGCVLGVPVGSVRGELESLGRIIDLTDVMEEVNKKTQNN